MLYQAASRAPLPRPQAARASCTATNVSGTLTTKPNAAAGSTAAAADRAAGRVRPHVGVACKAGTSYLHDMRNALDNITGDACILKQALHALFEYAQLRHNGVIRCPVPGCTIICHFGVVLSLFLLRDCTDRYRIASEQKFILQRLQHNKRCRC